jgi:hypothetical protein
MTNWRIILFFLADFYLGKALEENYGEVKAKKTLCLLSIMILSLFFNQIDKGNCYDYHRLGAHDRGFFYFSEYGAGSGLRPQPLLCAQIFSLCHPVCGG